MVFARTKLTIYDDVYDKSKFRKDITINYSGPNPQRFYNKVRELMVTVFKVPEEHIQEVTYTWEKAGEKQKFKFSWIVSKVFDVYSFAKIEVGLEGFVEGSNGTAKILFEPQLWSEFPQDTLLQQTIFWQLGWRLWMTLFYQKKRDRYHEFTKKITNDFAEGLKQYAEELRQGG
ncbi:MAG: hypothetical protein K0B07_05030 [DPANN group archaeon]|nr:hypothetical protein [DPANN group archaeon]